jgi:membrane protein DedA with SNARE-associated domain
MTVQAIVEAIVAFVRDHQSWAGPVAFLVAFMESFCFLSILWPGTAILVGISALLAAGGVSMSVLWPAIIYAALGGSLGYAISYWIGYYFKDSLLKSWPFNRHPETMAQGKEFFDKYGTASVFLGHFFGPVRAIIPVVAGMYAMRQLPFQIANIASASIWSAGVIAPGYFLVAFKEPIFDFIVKHEYIAAFGMFLLALVHAMPIPLLFWPSVALLLGGGMFYLYAGGDPILVLVAGVAGVFLGDLIGYRAGGLRKDEPHAVWPLTWYPDGIPAARAFLDKWGALGVIISKFLGVGRAYVPVIAGTSHMPAGKFIPASLVSAILVVAACLSPRYILQYFGM